MSSVPGARVMSDDARYLLLRAVVGEAIDSQWTTEYVVRIIQALYEVPNGTDLVVEVPEATDVDELAGMTSVQIVAMSQAYFGL